MVAIAFPEGQRNGKHGRVRVLTLAASQKIRTSIVSDVIKCMGDDTIRIAIDYPGIDAHFTDALDEFLETDGLDEGLDVAESSGTIPHLCGCD